MFGAILEESGGAQTLAVTMVRKFGDEKAAWALGITGLVVACLLYTSPSAIRPGTAGARLRIALATMLAVMIS